MMVEALYGCQFAECAEEVSYPAHMLKMLNGAPVCEDCVDDMGKVDWLDLEKFAPPEQAKIADLQAKLDKAVEALDNLLTASRKASAWLQTFSDTEFDRDGELSKIDAQLFVEVYDSGKALAAIKGSKA